MASTTADLAVVGGGVIGAACARAAVLRGLHVVIIEPGPDPAAASAASAGMLAAQIEPEDPVFLRAAIAARALHFALALELSRTTGIDVGLARTGIATLAATDADAARLRRSVDAQRAAGLRAEWLDAGDLARRWSGVSAECRGALFAPDDGAVDAPALTRALLADAERHGAARLRARVDRVTVTGGAVAGVEAGRDFIAAPAAVLAAGAWTPAIPGIPRALPVEPVRGQLVETAWPAGTPPAILYLDHGYVLARDGRAVLGSTMERVGFDARVTEAAVQGIRDRAARILPALARAPVARAWAGLRPLTPDGLPIVGRDPDVAGLFYATGHGRNGILLAPLTGAIIADLVIDGTTQADISPWRPDRQFA